jgi:hypothetical protein
MYRRKWGLIFNEKKNRNQHLFDRIKIYKIKYRREWGLIFSEKKMEINIFWSKKKLTKKIMNECCMAAASPACLIMDYVNSQYTKCTIDHQNKIRRLEIGGYYWI